MTYPLDSSGQQRAEKYGYDRAGNLSSYTNRAGNLESLCYDNRNRLWWFQWDDGYTSQQQTSYDPASRVTRIWNWDATINYTYWDNNLLKTEQEMTGSNYNHTTSYVYDADGNRTSLTCPSGKKWQYGYNQRNQLTAIGNENWVVLASYQYDRAGNRQQRALWNGVVTEYAPVDALNRSPWTRHMFNGTQIERFDYGFDDLNRMKYEQRGATADGYTYDKASEVTGFNRDGTLSNGVVTGGATMGLIYDLAGNRSQVTNNGTATNYSVNNLNEYTAVGSDAVESDVKGNVKTCNIKTYTQTNETWTYTYDAQNRLRLATGGGKTLEFWYDGLNRQITRRINGDNNQITRSVWDGWNLLEERDVNDAPREYYLHGARTDELVLRWGGSDGDHWYGYDGRGNVSHLFAYIYNGLITESYTYDLAGAPTFSGPNNQSLVENRFLFQGRDYLKEGGIYDYRNRFYHPGLGRFLQPDPVGLQIEGEKLSARSAAYFWSGKAPDKFTASELNLYRYCGNDPIDRIDPLGLEFSGRDVPYEPVDFVTIKGADKYGGTQWKLRAHWSTHQVKGGYSARLNRLDVTIQKRQIAHKVQVPGEPKARDRTPEQIAATKEHEDLHTAKGIEFHDKNQTREFPGVYKTREEARAKANAELNSDWDRAQGGDRTYHQPLNEWQDIQRRESFR